MSHHGFKLNFAVDHELLTIFIETLTGSTFEMVVTPIDSIASIKAKIQRVEGILVSQQHLLYNLQELDDHSRVQDYGIQDGSTIKLVLSMRGGPLGTARKFLPLDGLVVKEFVELNRNELEELPSGSKLAIIVFRDGESVNMFRVLENTDGSFSPLSPSSPTASFSKYFNEEHGTKNKAKSMRDNRQTKNKMEELRTRLEALSLQKKCDSKQEIAHEDIFTDEPVAGTSSNSRFPPIKGAMTKPIPGLNVQSTSIPELSSQVPVLPKISTQSYHIEAAPLTDEERPRSSPGKLTGQQICQILSEGKRSQLLSSHCTSTGINRLPQSSSDIDYESNWTNRGASGGGLSQKQGSLALCSPGPSRSLLNNVLPSRASINPLITENNILTQNIPVNEYKVVSQASPANMYKLSPITTMANTSNKSDVSKSADVTSTKTNVNTNTTSSSASAVSATTTAGSQTLTKKKSTRTRCSKCNKKLNISATYTCRCQKIFCPKHRYSEAHACTYDYKKEGRQQIADANPLVTAPKITKF